MQNIRSCLDELCKSLKIAKSEVVEQALFIIGCPDEPKRIVHAVLLYAVIKRDDLAEVVIRSAAQSLISQCDFFILSNDDIVHKRKTSFHVANLCVRRKATIVSWQLELCLYLHRVGVFSISE